MNSQKRLALLQEQFFKVIQLGLPSDLSVPEYDEWVGPEPIPFVDYRVEYEGDAATILRSVLNADPTLSPLLRKLTFRIAEHAPVLTVSLSRVAEFSV